MQDIIVCDIGARGGFHPRWNFIQDRLFAILIDADQTVTLERPPCHQFCSIKAPLWSAPETLTLHITRNPACSSVYEPNRQFLSRFPDPERFVVMERREVQAGPLYAWMGDWSIRPHFLKIDAQGAELPILQGADLGSVIGIEVEVSFLPIYQFAPPFAEVDDFLCRRGFELWDLNRYYWRDSTDNGMRCVMADALYFKNPQLVQETEIAATLQRAYRVTNRQRLAHAFQWATHSAYAPFQSDMQLGH